MCFFVQTNHTRKELLFLMFKEINLRNHSSLHKLFYSLYIYENEIDNYADFLMICIQKSDEWFDVAINNNTLAINKMIDYQKWAKDQDIISYDSYPTYDAPAYKPAFLYDLMRSL